MNGSKLLNTKTVIIGAGIAGIATAINLLDNNYNDFLIFEALDRVGGRVYSHEYGNSFLEFGAQYIHGQVDNPIFYIARDNKQIEEKYSKIYYDSDDANLEDNNGVPIDLEKDEDIDENDDSSYIFVTELGETINIKLAYKIYNLVNKVVRQAKDYCLSVHLDQDKSVSEFLYEEYTKLVDEEFISNDLNNDTNDEKIKKLIYGFFIWRCKCENIEIGCHSMSDLSLKNYCIFRDLKGLQIIQTKYGYGQIVKYMIESHKENFNSKLKLKHVLKKVFVCNKLITTSSSNRSDESTMMEKENCIHCSFTNDVNKLVVVLSDDNQKDLFVLCDNVVCTMSIGYLQENLSNLVEPCRFMPKEKLDSVSRLGYGTINKIFLIYEKPFWSKKLSGMQVIWLPKENEHILDRLDNFNENNWFENISYFEPVKDQTNILAAWIGGCVFAENFSDEKIAKDCTVLLKKLLARDDIPLPNKIIRSNWYSNKYFRGSYSFLPLGSSPSDLETLAEPIYINERPIIMFAGEGTSYRQFSTSQGAYFTGIRESERILNLKKT